ncbi:taste receptor type 2 member 140-like [Ctenodactylus gundi]
MAAVVQRILTIIFMVEFILGVLGNGFIALVNCMCWVKRRKLSSFDQIVTALAITRTGLLWSVATILSVSVLGPGELMSENFVRIMTLSWRVTGHFSIWLATCLSVFYFLKIANFSNSAFLYLKWRVKQVVSVIFLASLVVLLFDFMKIDSHACVLYGGAHQGNLSSSFRLKCYAQFFEIIVQMHTLLSPVPFVISLTTFLLLTFSLRKHLKRMQRNATGSRDASTRAHVKALQNVVASLLLYSVYFLSLLFRRVTATSRKETIFILFFQCAEMVLPSGHSFVLILGNSRLRQASLSALKRLR